MFYCKIEFVFSKKFTGPLSWFLYIWKHRNYFLVNVIECMCSFIKGIYYWNCLLKQWHQLTNRNKMKIKKSESFKTYFVHWTWSRLLNSQFQWTGNRYVIFIHNPCHNLQKFVFYLIYKKCEVLNIFFEKFLSSIQKFITLSK